VATFSTLITSPLSEPGAVLQQLGKYELLQIIGTGGMGSVYRARLQGPGGAAKEVALKLVHSHLSCDRNFVLMFLDEMRVAMAMAHRNIVQTFDAGEADGHQFMVMELVDGCSLRDLLRPGGGPEAMPLDVALFIAMEVSAALGYAHGFQPPGGGAAGVIHRDVSPANILLSAQGDVKLADFGVAKVAGGLHVTGVHSIKGKLAYMAPEQASGLVEPRSDIFALGAVLYRMVAGAPVRKVLDLEAVRLGIGALPPPSSLRPDLPPSLDSAIMGCLSTDPAARPASAEELRRALAEEAFRLQLEGGDLDPHARLQAFIAAAAQRAPSDAGRAGKLGALLLREAGALATDHGETSALAPTIIDTPSPTLTTTVHDASQPASPAPPPAIIDPEPPTGSLELAPPVAPRRWLWLLLGAALLGGISVGVAVSWRRPSGAEGGDVARLPDAGRRPPPDARRPDAPAPRADAAPLDRTVAPDQASPATERPVAVHHPRPATLDLNSIPWSQVLIDGRHRGHTPLQGLLLRPGRHVLRLVNSERGLSREIPLTVRAGQRLRKVIELK
jgi:serine/threonine protein kinase